MTFKQITYLVKGSPKFTGCLTRKKICFISPINARPNQNRNRR